MDQNNKEISENKQVVDNKHMVQKSKMLLDYYSVDSKSVEKKQKERKTTVEDDTVKKPQQIERILRLVVIKTYIVNIEE